MSREIEDGRVVIEDFLRPVSVVNVPIGYKDSLQVVVFLCISGGDCDVVEDAESHAGVGCGMMPRRADRAEGGIDLTAYELTAASTLVFGQTAGGIPVVVIRGCEYERSETANILNTLWSWTSDDGVKKAIKDILRATSYAKGLKTHLLLQVASWFV